MTDRPSEPLLSGALHESWMRPGLFELQRLPTRPPLIGFPDVAGARQGQREASPWHRSLDGDWRFRLYERPADVPAEIASSDYDDADWNSIAVPGCWTRQGHDHPHYTNFQMPWRCEPPRVPDENPTGVYRTRFVLDETWAQRRSVLSIGGAESVGYVWCNGSFVGMGKDSRLASEFDLTDVVQPGDNALTVVVIRWSDGTWLEDQDHWYHAGLHREVLLYSTDHVWLADLDTRAGLDSAGRGTLRALAAIGSSEPLRPGWRVEVVVENARGRRLIRKPLRGEVPTPDHTPPTAPIRLSYGYGGPYVSIEASDLATLPWSHETPTRYRLICSLVDPDGEVREVSAQWIGFRRVEIAEGELRLNGEPVLIRGVNRHDHHPVHGKTVSLEDMRADLVDMKRFGMNALRTAHYPNDPRLLDLCDEIGLWVIDEANVETHARLRSLLQDEAFAPAVLARIKRMLVRDRSHACVMGWSLGNESGYAPVHDEAAAWIRRVDPSRFVHYEGALQGDFARDPADDASAAATDVVCPMYPPLDTLREWARSQDGRRPLIMCEYSHAMGNSNGSLHDYWALIESTEGLQGGFVWDWKDQGLLERRADGRPWYAFGGHFGDEPNDASFCCNGLMGADGAPHSGAFEHAKLAEIVRAEPAAPSRGAIRIENRQYYRDLSWLRASWQVEVDGVPEQRGKLALPELGPQQSARVVLPIVARSLDRDQTATLSLRFLTRRRTAWAPAGFEVAWSQIELPWRRRKSATVTLRRAARVPVDVDPDTGTLQVGERLVGTPRPCLWRAPTDNDGVKQGWMSQLIGVRRRWVEWGLDQLGEQLMDVTRKGRRWIVVRELRGANGEKALHRQTISLGEGAADLLEQIETPKAWDDLPRIGVRLVVDGRFDALEWLGLGPHASYPDRRQGARFGRFGGRVSEQYEPYAVPQEHGGHVDTRWLTLRDTDGHGVRILGDPTLAFTASHYSLERLTAALDQSQLEAGDDIHVHLDAAVRGVGTGACGPDTLPAYRVSSGRRRWRWRVEAI